MMIDSTLLDTELILVSPSDTITDTILKMDILKETSFGEWLKRQRKALSLTQDQLARQLSCSTITLRKIEAEERRPSLQMIEQLAKIFSVPLADQAKFQSFARGNLLSFMKGPAEIKPWQTQVTHPRSNIPASTTALIGRREELTTIHEYLLDTNIRLITLMGPPGIGKTRLGLEGMRESLSNFPDGVFFVPLAPLEKSSQVASAIFQALNYVESKNQFTFEELAQGIGDKQMLIVLDNLEHLIEDSAPLVSRLLSTCPRLKILATSRESLRVPGEWLYPVSALNFPNETIFVDLEDVSHFAALTLFAERARAVSAGFSLSPENVQAVASICAHLDGVPLAIELIASRVRFMSPQKLLQQMNEPFIMSADGMRAVSARQKTLRNAIQWSYNLLSPEEQELLIWLSIFSGSFTMDAVEGIFADVTTKRSVSDLVASLLDKSLLKRSPDEYDGSRFSILMMIREFSLEQLRKAGKENELRNKHLTYYLNLAEDADQEVHGSNQIVWMERIVRDHNNFQTALDWCLTNQYTEFALRLLGALGWTWWIRGHYSELHSWFNRIRALEGIHDHPASYAKLLNRVAAQCSDVSENLDAQSLLDESRQIWLTLGDNGERGLADCLNWLALVISYGDGSLTEAMSLAEQSLALYRKHNDIWGCAHSLFQIGDIDSRSNRSASSRPFFEQSLSMFEQVGDLWGKSQVYQSLGRMYLDLEQYENARSCFEEMMKMDQDLQFISGIIGGLRDLGSLHFVQGLEQQAQRYYEESLTICRQYGMGADQYSLSRLGLLALHQNNMPVAARHLNEMYNSVKGMDTISNARDLCWGFAALAGSTNQPERAARLSGAGQAIIDKTGYQYPPFFRAIFDRHIQIAFEQLGKTRFETLSAEGRAMTTEEAVDYALEE